MADKAHRLTDEKLEEMEKRLSAIDTNAWEPGVYGLHSSNSASRSLEMKNRNIIAYIRDYILLLFIVICLVTAGLMISNIVISAVKPFVNPAAYPVTEDTGVLSDKQAEVYHSILAAVDSGSCTVSVPKMMDYEKNEITVQLGLHYGTMERVFSLVSWGEDTAALDLILFSEFEEQKIVVDAKVDEALRNLYEGSDRFKLW